LAGAPLILTLAIKLCCGSEGGRTARENTAARPKRASVPEGANSPKCGQAQGEPARLKQTEPLGSPLAAKSDLPGYLPKLAAKLAVPIARITPALPGQGSSAMRNTRRVQKCWPLAFGRTK
jgi:hypothetical protein